MPTARAWFSAVDGNLQRGGWIFQRTHAFKLVSRIITCTPGATTDNSFAQQIAKQSGSKLPNLRERSGSQPFLALRLLRVECAPAE